MAVQTVVDINDIDPLWNQRSDEDKRALRAGALSAPDRKIQCWGLPCDWRDLGPFDWTGCDAVEVVIGRLSGVPTLRDTRFSADNLLHLHESGMSAEEIVEDYYLVLDQVRPVLEFAARMKHQSLAA